MSFTLIGTQPPDTRSIIDGPLFRQLLAQEKKRSERSGNSFLLVVMRIQDDLRSQGEQEALAMLRRRIFSKIRDTDVVGWYDENESALGILFTEIGDPNQTSVSAVLGRVREAVSRPVMQERPGEIRCRVFEKGESHHYGSLEPYVTTGD